MRQTTGMTNSETGAAAAEAFRAQFIDALQRLRQSSRNNDRDATDILTDDVMRNHELAKIAFKPYLSGDARKGFEKAWEAYFDPNWVKSPRPRNIDQRSEDIALALERIEAVLAFAQSALANPMNHAHRGDPMPSPAQFLREATRAVPAVKYAVGIGGVIAVVAIVRSFSISPALALLGAIVMLFLMGVLVVFARMSALGKTHMLLPALVFTWFVLGLFILTSLGLFGSVFLGLPEIHIPSLNPVAESIPSAKPTHPMVETPAIGSGESCPASLKFAGILHADSRPGDANDRKVDQSLLLPAGVQLDTSYQQATNRDLAGDGAESNLSPADIPGGIFIAGRGSSERGNRWAILTPYDKTIPILARSEDPTKIGNTRYRVTLGLYVDAGHPGNGFGSVDALVCFKSLSAKPATGS